MKGLSHNIYHLLSTYYPDSLQKKKMDAGDIILFSKDCIDIKITCNENDDNYITVDLTTPEESFSYTDNFTRVFIEMEKIFRKYNML